MSHYRTGTVNVTNGSLSVVGVGTDFIAGAAIGECLAAPDGKLYEIASIQSATGLTLGTSYLGATVTGQAYSIIPTQSYIRDLALQAATLVNGYQSIVGGAGSGKFDDGTVGSPGIQFAADANTGIRRTGTDAVAVVTGGVDRITVSSAGVVAVPGNTALGDAEASDTHAIKGATTLLANSASTALKITQDGAGYALEVADVTGDTTPFTIDASGNTGIKTGTPGADLHVNGTTAAVRIGATTSSQYLDILRDSVDGYFKYNAAQTTFRGHRFQLGGTDAFVIGAEGQTTLLANSASAALTVTQTGSGNAFVVEDSASTDSTPFVVNAAGIVNVAHPTAITGALAAVMHLQVAKTDSEAIGAYLFNASSSGPALEFGQSNNATVGSHTVVANGDTLGVIRFSGSDGTNFIRGAQIVCAVDGTPGTNDMPGRLIFSTTADGASSPTERMRIDSAGNVGIGGAANAHTKVGISGTLPSSSALSMGFEVTATVSSTSTTGGLGYRTDISTQAAAFTTTYLKHYQANLNAIGASSVITNQFAFIAEASLTGATNNYGFYSNIAAAANRYNFYAAGTADNYFAGKVGIGAAPAAAYGSLRISNLQTGGTAVTGVVHEGSIAADVTATANYFGTFASTSASAFTLTSLRHFFAQQGTIGAGSTVTNQSGFESANTLIGATNNIGFTASNTAAVTAGKTAIGFYSAVNIATGGGTTYGFYAAGTAPNYFAGDTTVAGNLTANGQTVGYLNIPQNSQSAPYTLVIGDAGKHILHPSADTTARTITIPANSSVAFPIGTAVTFVNQASAGVMTIAITTDTMRLAGAGTTGSRTLAANGVATAIKLTSTEWIISGTNLT